MKLKVIVWFILFISIIAINASGDIASDLNTAAVGYWKLEETNFNFTDAVNALNLTTGTIGARTTGKIDYGHNLTRAGNDQLKSVTSALFEDTSFSACAWVNVYASVAHQTIMGVTYGNTPNIKGWAIEWRSDDKLYLWIYNNNAVVTTISGGPTLNLNQWYHICVTYNTGASVRVLVNGSNWGSKTNSNNVGYSAGNMFLTLGAEQWDGPTRYIDGAIDEVSYFNTNLTDTEIQWLYNGGSPTTNQQYPFSSSPLLTNFSIYAYDSYNSTALNEFSANVTYANGSSQIFSTNTGIITLYNDTQINTTANITIFNVTNYYNDTKLNVNIEANTTSSLSFYLDKFSRVYDVTYSSVIQYGAVNYTRNLTYSINISCPSWSTTNLTLYNNNISTGAISLNCTNQSYILTGSYQSGIEGNRNISFYLETNINAAYNNGFNALQNFTYDLYNPFANHNFTRESGFNNHTTNVSLLCTDNVAPILTYNNTFNSVVLHYDNETNATWINNATILNNGVNIHKGFCADFFGTTYFNESETIYVKTLILIDERENDYFNVNNISGARVYFDDNSSFFDFKTEGTNVTNFTGVANEKLRFELIYADGTIITRYVDVTLIDDNDLRVCANKEGITHYEQLIISATEQPVVMRSVFSDCLVAADYTRFAYQDSFLLKAFTISQLYYLYTFDDNDQQIILASVDGSVSTYMNLDTLEFAKQTYNLGVSGDTLTFEKISSTEMQLYYLNIDQDNVNTSVVISNVATGVTYLSTSELTSPNNFTINFNWATFSVDNSTLFKVVVTTLDADGNEGTIKKYFNSQAASGLIKSGVALAIALLLTIFGLTFAATRITLSWFGAGVLLISIAVLVFAIPAWFITLMLVIDIIVLIYIIIIMVTQNYSTMIN